jgi:hypothetical protein
MDGWFVILYKLDWRGWENGAGKSSESSLSLSPTTRQGNSQSDMHTMASARIF